MRSLARLGFGREEVLSKARYYERLTLVLDNLGGIFAWLFMVLVGVYLGRIPESAYYQHVSLLVFLVPIQMLALSINHSASRRLTDQSRYLVKGFGSVLLAIVAIIFIAKLEFVSRLVVLGYALMSVAGLMVVKAFLQYWYFHGRKERAENFTKVLIIGCGPRAQELASQLFVGGDWGTEIVGFFDPDLRIRSAVSNGSKRLCNFSIGNHGQSGVRALLATTVVDEVIIALPRKLLGEIEDIVVSVRAGGDPHTIGCRSFQHQRCRHHVFRCSVAVPVLEFQPVAQNENMLLVKRIFDLILTILAAPVLIVVFLLIGLAVKLDSPGPVFFNQERVGLNKRKFRMFKFRSMFEDAEARLAEIEHLNEADGPIFKIKDDPRVTRVGKFIRKTSLDELPQLINVLLGI